MNKIFFCALIMTGFSIKAQNYVPNYSFEDTARKVTFFYLPSAWDAPNGEGFNYFTPLQNTVNPFLDWGSPSNILGYQVAKTGNAYIGILMYHLYTLRRDITREYAQAKLTRPLIQDSSYCLQLFVSLADSSHFASRGQLGVHFSDTSYFIPSYRSLPFTPQIIVSPTQYIGEKTNWMEFNFQYKAQGGEEYITLGNFNDTTYIDTLFVGGGDSTNINFLNTYYYIDDIWLSHCDSLPDTTIGLSEKEIRLGIDISPNPFKNQLNINAKSGNQIQSVELFNLSGQIVPFKYLKIAGNEVIISTEQLSPGLYFLQLITEQGLLVRKLIKQN